ncbi:hypothetical protein N752_22125 [Desulforamulus aquiferis]|nr:hypothetical protein N752_22125 [Desulforamulus aquiferis]
MVNVKQASNRTIAVVLGVLIFVLVLGGMFFQAEVKLMLKKPLIQPL